ncbi:MAG: pyruvate formate lyase family protein [Coriobacteriales bacterium]|jgi:pyruvate-formate lyase
MYEFRPVSDRTERMRARVRDRLIVADAEKEKLKLEASYQYKNYPPILAKVYESQHVIENMPINIQEEELFAGDMGNKGWGAANGSMWLMADIENTWPIEEDGLHHAPLDDPLYSKQLMAIHPDDLKELRGVMQKRLENNGNVWPKDWLPDGVEDFFALQANPSGRKGGFPIMLPPGHLTPGFQNILGRGFADIRKQAQDFLDEHKGNIQGDNIGKYIFYKAATVACDSATTMCLRYAECAREQAQTASPERAAELEKMADGLEWISEKTPRNFWEALQLTMMYNCFLKVDNDPGVTSLGRFDQYTWPYLKKDLEEGNITLDQAQEFVDAFFLKINTFYGGGFGKTMQTAGIGHLGQHTTIGGVIPETGEDATNPVSYMVLEAMSRLQLHEPTVSLRCTKDTPKEMWDCAMATSTKVGGLPLLQNDDVIVPAIQQELGWDIEDARNFAFIGCQEITGSGNDYPAPNGSNMGHNGIYWQIALLMAINDGVNPMNGVRCPEEVCSGTLADMKSMDEVRAAFEKICKWEMDWSATLNNYVEHEYPRLFPFPNLSISTTGCMESGKDVSEGGAKHNSYGGTATGLATTGDSLTAIKYMVFDKKLCTGEELLKAVLANWEGYEDLRTKILTEVPHFGNSDEYADSEMEYVTKLYYDITRAYSTERCDVYKCGTFGASDHVVQGEFTWATPDGRKAGEPIADACSPCQGRDVNGPTGVFTSSTKIDHSHFLDGMALNIKIHPTVMENRVDKVEDATKTYFDMGGMEVQYNVVNADTLRKAQKNPDDYHNLVVRIAGFSAYFVDMTTEMQEDIISRNEHQF